MEQEVFKVHVDKRKIVETINTCIQNEIRDHLNANLDQVRKTISVYFQRSFFNDKKNEFESALDWTVEQAFREGLSKAMDELNFKEMIAKEAKDLLSTDSFIKELAEAKVRSSLGLPPL